MNIRLSMLLNIRRTFNYSTVRQLEDWEYVSHIIKNLKQKNINQAMRYLINSHLQGVVLDRQTFYNMHKKMEQLKSALSYQELLYKIYRQSFSPHLLVINWMEVISSSKDKKLLQLLNKDFKFLNLDPPKQLIQNLKRGQDVNTQQKDQKQQQTQKRKNKRRKALFNLQKQKSNVENQNISVRQIDESKDITNQLYKFKIIYDKMQIEYNDNSVNPDIHIENQDEDMDDQDLLELQHLIRNIKHINIEKIQVVPITGEKQQKPNKPKQ